MGGYIKRGYIMRDPKRIDNILKLIGVLWNKYPDMRFMQLLASMGFLQYNDDMTVKDPFYIEDEIILKLLEAHNESQD